MPDPAVTEVRVVPDFTGFADALKAGVDNAVRNMSASVTRGLAPIDKAAATAGAAVGSAIGAGADQAAKAVGKIADQAKATETAVSIRSRRAGDALVSGIATSANKASSALRDSIASGASSAGESLRSRLTAAVSSGAGQVGSTLRSVMGSGAEGAATYAAARLRDGIAGASSSIASGASQIGNVLRNAVSLGASQGAAEAGMQLRDGLADAAKSTGQVMAGMWTVAIVAATAFTAQLVSAGLEYNVLEQRSRAALTTILGTREAAIDMADQVREFARSSPFPRQAFIKGTQQLLAFGFEAKQIIPTLGAVQDAVAAAGGGSLQLSEVLTIMAKIRSTGKLYARDLIEFGNRGINAAKLIADAMGTTEADVRSQITDGAFTADKAISLLIDGMNAKFGGAAANLKTTFVGATDRVKGAIRDLGSALVTPFVNPNGGGAAVDWANGLANILRAIESTVVPLLAPGLQRIADSVDKIVQALFQVATPENLTAAVGLIGQLAPYAAAATAAVTIMGGQSIPIIGRLFAGFNPLVSAAIAFAMTLPEVRSAVANVAASVAPLAAELLNRLMPALNNLSDLAASVLPNGVRLFGTALQAVLVLLMPIADGLALVTGFMADHTAVVYGLAAAYVAVKAAGIAAAVVALPAAVAQYPKIAAASAAFSTLATSMRAFAAASAINAAAGQTNLLVGAMRSVMDMSVGLKGLGVGAFVGFAVGAGIATQAIDNIQRSAEGYATKFTEDLKVAPGTFDDNVRGMNAINAEVQRLERLLGKETGIFGDRAHRLGDNLLGRDGGEKIIRQIRELEKEGAKLAQSNTNLAQNAGAIAPEFGITAERVSQLARGFGIDLTQAFEKSQLARDQLADNIRALGVDAEVTGRTMQEAIALDPEMVKAQADEIRETMTDTAQAFGGFFDVLQIKDEPLDPKQLKSAEQAVEDAQRRLEELQNKGDDKGLRNARRSAERTMRDARQRLEEAEAATQSHHDTWEEAINAGKKLDKARQEYNDAQIDTGQSLADAQESANDSATERARAIEDATRQLSDAQAALDELRGTDSPLNGDKIKKFYEDQLSAAETFAADIQTAINMGLTPDLIGRMLTEGPEKAGPLLEAIVSDTSGGMVEIVNAAEQEISRLSASAVRTAQLTQQAIQAGTPEAAAQLNKAVLLSNAALSKGFVAYDPRSGTYASTGKGSLDDLANSVGLSPEEAQRIAETFKLTEISGLARDTTVALRVDAAQPIATMTDLRNRFAAYVASDPEAKARLNNAGVIEQMGLSGKLFEEFVRYNPTAQAFVGIDDVRSNSKLIQEWATRWAGTSAEATFLAVASTDAAEVDLEYAARERKAWIFLNLVDGVTKGIIKIGEDISLASFEGQTGNRRWGGIHETARWGRLPASVVKSPTILFGERETGGEAMIPRLGNPVRSEAILQHAASWYGGRYVTAKEAAKAPWLNGPVWPAASGAVWENIIRGWNFRDGRWFDETNRLVGMARGDFRAGANAEDGRITWASGYTPTAAERAVFDGLGFNDNSLAGLLPKKPDYDGANAGTVTMSNGGGGGEGAGWQAGEPVAPIQVSQLHLHGGQPEQVGAGLIAAANRRRWLQQNRPRASRPRFGLEMDVPDGRP